MRRRETGRRRTAAGSPQDRELSWRRIDNALRLGLRGLSGRDSLAQLLARERGVRNVGDLSALTENLIRSWADRHKRRTGRWPTENSGPVADAPGEVWYNVNAALLQGLRGFPGGSSLAVLTLQVTQPSGAADGETTWRRRCPPWLACRSPDKIWT
jgi:hypothetical protein